jgi:hypothetical protein
LPNRSSALSLISSFKLTLGQTLLQIGQLDLGDGADLRLVQRTEHHQLVQPIDELRTEVRLHHAHHRGLHLRVLLLGIAGLGVLDHLRAEVRGHHDHGVAEIHRAALTIGQATVVEHLQQHVEHIRMRLLHFVQQITLYGRRRTASVR